MIVCDTGPLVAAALANDDHHHACVELFTGLHLARRPLLVPATVVAEVGYLLGREAGPKVELIPNLVHSIRNDSGCASSHRIGSDSRDGCTGSAAGRWS